MQLSLGRTTKITSRTAHLESCDVYYTVLTFVSFEGKIDVCYIHNEPTLPITPVKEPAR